jgi:sporulation protein YunB
MLRKKHRLIPKFLRGPLPFRHVLLITFIFFLISSAFSLWLIDKSIEPVIMNIATKEVKRVATEVINESIHENISEQINMDEMVVTDQQNGNKGPTVSFNPKLYNTVRSETIRDIQSKLGISEENPFTNSPITVDPDKEQLKSVIYYIPLGVVTQTSILANFGPKIPVEMALVGDVEMEFQTKMTEAGINNIFLELFAVVKVNVEIVIPTFEEETPVEQTIKIYDRLIPGEVPNFYGNEKGSLSPAVILP